MIVGGGYIGVRSPASSVGQASGQLPGPLRLRQHPAASMKSHAPPTPRAEGPGIALYPNQTILAVEPTADGVDPR